MAQQPYQQRPPQYQQPYPPQQYPQQQYGQQYPQQGGPGGYIRPKTNTAAWILGIMCVVFFVGFIIMMIMFLQSNPQAQEQVTRANKAEAELGHEKAKAAANASLISQGRVDISKERLQREISMQKKAAETYWKALSTEKQNEFKNTGLRIDDVSADRDGRTAHVTLSNGYDKTLLNVEVEIQFWDRDVMAYVQPEVIPSIPPRTKDGPFKKQYDFPIKSNSLNPAWHIDAVTESGGTSKVRIID